MDRRSSAVVGGIDRPAVAHGWSRAGANRRREMRRQGQQLRRQGVRRARTRKCAAASKQQGKGTLATTAEACLTADAHGKVQTKKDKVTSLFATGGACEGCESTDLVTDATTINGAQVAQSIALAHDIFGANLDGGQLSTVQAESKCQDKLEQRTGQLFDAWVKQFRKCKKTAMKDGATTDAAVIAACLSVAGGARCRLRAARPEGKGRGQGRQARRRRADHLRDARSRRARARRLPGRRRARRCGEVPAGPRRMPRLRGGEASGWAADRLRSRRQRRDRHVSAAADRRPVRDSQFRRVSAALSVLALPGAGRDDGDRLAGQSSRRRHAERHRPRVLDPAPYNQLDGFSPMDQVSCTSRRASTSRLSDAARLLAPACCGQPAGPPWIDTRTYTTRVSRHRQPGAPHQAPTPASTSCTGSRSIARARQPDPEPSNALPPPGHESGARQALHRRHAQSEDAVRRERAARRAVRRLARQHHHRLCRRSRAAARRWKATSSGR